MFLWSRRFREKKGECRHAEKPCYYIVDLGEKHGGVVPIELTSRTEHMMREWPIGYFPGDEQVGFPPHYINRARLELITRLVVAEMGISGDGGGVR
jgi:hypothetical protein